jgi:hypothetical protein
MDCWIVIGAETTKFLRPILSLWSGNCCFPRPRGPPHNLWAWRTSGNAALQGKPQLTCRTGAPKTRHHSGRLAPKHGIQGEKKWAMYSFATP